VSPDVLNQFVPGGWRSPWFGRTLDLDWSALMPAVNKRIANDGWTLFSAFWGMLLFKGLLQAGAGPRRTMICNVFSPPGRRARRRR
jgi:hypothetical protein